MEEGNSTLLPCPYCGNKETYLAIRGDRNGFSVLCESCGLTGPCHRQQGKAAEAWNAIRIKKEKGIFGFWEQMLKKRVQ
ncbi:MAG: Lar family restriction alleviation protein [Desulfovibrio sp.]|nr:Lar family restriction alleviation protein [Desulfovibrio sp.]